MSTVNINLQAKDLTASLTGAVDPTPDTVAQRSGTGTLKATTPSANNDLTTKQYVDSVSNTKVSAVATANKIYGTDANGNAYVYTQTAGQATRFTVVLRDTNGCVKCATPQSDNDAATKAYVDNAGILTSPNGTKYKIIVSDSGALSTQVVVTQASESSDEEN